MNEATIVMVQWFRDYLGIDDPEIQSALDLLDPAAGAQVLKTIQMEWEGDEWCATGDLANAFYQLTLNTVDWTAVYNALKDDEAASCADMEAEQVYVHHDLTPNDWGSRGWNTKATQGYALGNSTHDQNGNPRFPTRQ